VSVVNLGADIVSCPCHHFVIFIIAVVIIVMLIYVIAGLLTVTDFIRILCYYYHCCKVSVCICSFFHVVTSFCCIEMESGSH